MRCSVSSELGEFSPRASLSQADHLEFGEQCDEGDDSSAGPLFVGVKSLADCVNEKINGGRTTAFYLIPKRNACPVEAVVEERFQVKGAHPFHHLAG